MGRVDHELSRRNWLGLAAGGLATGLIGSSTVVEAQGVARASRPRDEPFLYGLNTSTIREHHLPIEREAELAAKVGYKGLEPWLSELDEYGKRGQSLDKLGRTFRDLGLSVESAIGFFEWGVDDETRRRKALDVARRNMESVKAVGGLRLAAPPVGLTDRADVDPRRLAERYRALLELGDEIGVVPQVEVWGFSKTLGNLADAVQVAIASDHPKACVLADVYHMYKGGSGVHGLRLLSKDAMYVLHMNDYPADPPRDRIKDSDRIYPGDGIAPLKSILRSLDAIGFRGMLSVELFNKQYYKDDAETMLRTAFDKMRAVVKASLAGAT